jgi:hypothetical protein
VIPFRDGVPGVSGSDVPEGRFALNDNIDSFKAFMATLKAKDGGDAQEASLLAVEEALADLVLKEAGKDTLQVIFIVTDVTGHRGAAPAGGTRNCDIQPTVSRFNALSAEQQKLVKIFYSAPSDEIWGCGGYKSAAAQYADLIDKSLTTVSKNSRGGSVAWKFNADGLVNKFSEMIVNTTPPIDLVCLDEKADFYINNTMNVQWVSPARSSVYGIYKNTNKLTIAKAFQAGDVTAIGQGKGKLSVQRCCVSKTAAEAGNYSSCLKSTTVPSLPFTFQQF